MKRLLPFGLLLLLLVAALPILAATLFSDNFNRADNDLLGGNWVERGVSVDFDIVTNRVELITAPDAATHGVAYNTTTLGTADYTVRAIVNSSSGNNYHGVCGRRVNSGSTDSDSYSAFIKEDVDSIYLFKRVSGTWTQIGSYAITITAGVDYTVKLSMQGTTIKMFLDGVERISVTDSSLSAAGDACIDAGGGGATGTRWDDFLVEDFGANAQLKITGAVKMSGAVRKP
jgi:hypothetical protein